MKDGSNSRNDSSPEGRSVFRNLVPDRHDEHDPSPYVHEQRTTAPPLVYDAPSLLNESQAETSNFAAIYSNYNDNSTSSTRTPAVGSLRDAARRVSMLNRTGLLYKHVLSSSHQAHQRVSSRAQDLLSAIQEGGHLSNDEHGDDNVLADDMSRSDLTDEEEQLLGTASDAANNTNDTLPTRRSEYGSVLMQRQESTSQKSVAFRRMRSWRRKVAVLFHPTRMLRIAWESFLFRLGLPFCIAAWLLYYPLGNPEVDALPGKTRLSWWFNFAGRQVITLELARLTQWLLLDLWLCRSGSSARERPWWKVDPLVTLWSIHSRGWPFLISTWALWDLLILHGDNPFNTHWLYWTGWALYSNENANSGAFVISSDLYLRILLAMLVAGIATAAKCVYVVLQFSRRQVQTFQIRLKAILGELVTVSQIAALATQADLVAAQLEMQMDEDYNAPVGTSIRSIGSSLNKSTRPQSSLPRGAAPVTGNTNVRWSNLHFEEHDSKAPEHDDDDDDSSRSENTPGSSSGLKRSLSQDSSGSLAVLSLLDRWEPPVNKANKSDVAISDVLKFQQALRYMDDDAVFGEDFGPARDRNECVGSAVAMYHKLVKWTPDSYVLKFDTLEILAMDEDGVVDPLKRKMLRKLFRPDRSGRIPLVAFIQSIDAVYKRLRYFRASVTNATVIDDVLEHIVDGLFYFILSLVVLSLLNFNPWTFLVPITSLMVSLSFAFGGSLSKYVEGVLLIAVRRPYDLGDRIFIGSAEAQAESDMSIQTWFVEDINLTTTTLRFARTNEVSTVNNWAISGSRIINCNRSPNALIFYEWKLHISIFDGKNLDNFKEALNKYVRDHPRTWNSLAFIRHDVIDADMEQVGFRMAFRHRNGWQDAARIKLNRADLLRYIHDTAKAMGVNFETSPARRLLYYGGVLESGQVKDYKKNLLRPSNIRSHSHTFDDHRFESSYPGTAGIPHSPPPQATRVAPPPGDVLMGE